RAVGRHGEFNQAARGVDHQQGIALGRACRNLACRLHEAPAVVGGHVRQPRRGHLSKRGRNEDPGDREHHTRLSAALIGAESVGSGRG
ncbi:MAG: hypothetical protein ACK55I_03765, partial [bacterium]